MRSSVDNQGLQRGKRGGKGNPALFLLPSPYDGLALILGIHVRFRENRTGDRPVFFLYQYIIADIDKFQHPVSPLVNHFLFHLQISNVVLSRQRLSATVAA